MTDCIHNDKRTCFNERLEMVAEIERLRAEAKPLCVQVPDTAAPDSMTAKLLERIASLEGEINALDKIIGLRDALITTLTAELGAADEENLEIKQKIRAYRDAELALGEAIEG